MSVESRKLYEAISSQGKRTDDKMRLSIVDDDLKILIDAYVEEIKEKEIVLRTEIKHLFDKAQEEKRKRQKADKRTAKATRTTEKMIKILNRFMKGKE